ncbi:hypothetical protein DSO57_1009077 [Entomophthora muscae]|uniref:Uncharacterized protein n=1 Tax=Entomophthora muscae TaxID=34485 RepID=A0ACC2RLQ5_9FUNG|nr:hypothetical protein DSO57_1009077 [Entomophthora muscae]
MSFIRGLFQKVKGVFPTSKRLVGTDLQGNRYYEEPRGSFPRRTIELNDGRSHYQDVSDTDLPVQWMAWLRHTRSHAPTHQELEYHEAIKKSTIQKAKKLELEWANRKLELQAAKSDESAKEKLPKPKLNEAFDKKEFEPEPWSPSSVKK